MFVGVVAGEDEDEEEEEGDWSLKWFLLWGEGDRALDNLLDLVLFSF